MQTPSSSSLPPRSAAAAPAAPLSPALAGALDQIARRHGFGPEAVRTLWDALALGRGGMAQFSHRELGGSGQWLRGGMVMVGDMFNRSLAARVGALADELAQLHDAHPEFAAGAAASEWWPAGLHSPATSGAQNGVRYAWFPIQQRLAIERGGAVELYDTQDHIIGGVSQQQGRAGTLSFSSQHGPLDLAALRRAPAGAAPPAGRAEPSPAPAGADRAAALAAVPPAPAAPAPGRGDAPHALLDTIDKLAELHQRGVLTDEEFKSKKAELLGRL